MLLIRTVEAMAHALDSLLEPDLKTLLRADGLGRHASRLSALGFVIEASSVVEYLEEPGQHLRDFCR